MRTLTAALSFFLICANAFAEEQEKQKGRYRVGIGVSALTIVKDKTVYGYNNERGQLTDKVMLHLLSKEMSVAKAGIEEFDVLEAINGENVDGWEPKKIFDFLESGREGETLKLKMVRYDKNGTIVKDFTVEVMKMKNDLIAHLLDRKIGASVDNGDAQLSVESMVAEQKDGFLFTYTITNRGKSDLMVQWQTPHTTLFLVKKGETKKVTVLASEGLPHLDKRLVRVFIDMDKEIAEGLQKDGTKFEDATGVWLLVAQHNLNTFFPR